jgi:hypothetical protein
VGWTRFGPVGRHLLLDEGAAVRELLLALLLLLHQLVLQLQKLGLCHLTEEETSIHGSHTYRGISLIRNCYPYDPTAGLYLV